jgi:hypothetical protein
MQTPASETSLCEMLGNAIKELEKIEDDPRTLTFVARRLGNIVKHMKDLCEDLQPRARSGGTSRSPETNFRPPQRIDTMR